MFSKRYHSSLVISILMTLWSIQYLRGQSEDNLKELAKQLDLGTHLEIGFYQNDTSQFFALEAVSDSILLVPSHPHQLFEIGSITKVFTAYLAHRVIEKHSIELGTTLKKLPLSFPIHKRNKASLLNLMNHTSLLPKMPANFLIGMLRFPKNPYQIYHRNRLIKYYRKFKTKEKLKSRFLYSNFGYAVLGLVISDLEQTTYKALFEQYVTQGLQLNNTQIGISPSDYVKLYGYSDEKASCIWDWNKVASAGGAYSTTHDLLQFSQMVLNKGKLPLAVKKGLTALEKETISLKGEEKIGQGWRIFTKKDTYLLYHEGGTRGYKSLIMIDVLSKKSIVLLSKNCGLNKNNGLLKQIGIKFMDLVSP